VLGLIDSKIESEFGNGEDFPPIFKFSATLVSFAALAGVSLALYGLVFEDVNLLKHPADSAILAGGCFSGGAAGHLSGQLIKRLRK
jgi:hypothetical protein